MKPHSSSLGDRQRVVASLALAGLLAIPPAFAAIEVTGSGTYTETFDGLPALAHHTEFDWTDDVTVKGFYLHRSNAPTGTNNIAGALTLAAERPYASDGSEVATTAPNFHGFLDLGLSNDAERSLGFDPTTNDGATNWAGGELSMVAIVTNTGALPVNITEITYDIEVYRNNGDVGVVEPITFTAKQGLATDLLNELASYTNTPRFSTPGYTDVAGGAFTYIYDNQATSIPPVIVLRSATLTPPISLLPGGSVALRWGNANEAGADAQIGIDNLSITTVQAACAITAAPSNIVRNTNGTVANENDDTVEFDVLVQGAGSVSASGWKVTGPAGSAIVNQTGSYGVSKHFAVPYGEFLPSGSLTFDVQDAAGGAACAQTFSITAPLTDTFISSAVSRSITFTEPAASAQSFTRTPSSTELSWSSSATTGLVRNQPDGPGGPVSAKYFGVNNGTPTFTTEAVNISSVASVNVKADFAAYTTSTSATEADDNINAIVETSDTADFSNPVEVGRLVSSTGNGALDGAALFNLIKVATPGINYPAGQPYPDSPFPFVTRELEFARGTANYVRLRVTFDNDSGSEWWLMDNVVFSGRDCAISAAANFVFRDDKGTPSDPSDDTVDFTLSVTGQGAVSPSGWKIVGPSGSIFENVTGAYGVDKTFSALPVAVFGASLTVDLTVQDAGAGAACQTTVSVTSPRAPLYVTPTQSRVVTFSPAAIGANNYPRPEGGTEPGWTGGVALAHVQEQPSPAPAGIKYFDINTTAHPAGDVLQTEGVNIMDLTRVLVSVNLAAYTTSGTALEADDVIDVFVEVSPTPDFQLPTLVAGGRLVDSTVTTGDALFNEIKVSDPGINYGTNPYPSTAFPFVTKTVVFDRAIGDNFVRVRISGGVNSGSEHILVDDIVFANGAGGGLDSDSDGIPDSYESANGLNPNSNADRDTDLDGDGQSNYREYLAGTAANDATSTLRIVSFTHGLGAGTLVWTSVAGKTYRVETSTDLMTWTDQGFDYPSDGNGTTTSIYMPPVGGTYFVRVVAKP